MSQNAAPSLSALQQLADIRDYVMEAQRLLKAGQMPDMTSLEARTADLCRIIRETTSDIQKQCAPELRQLAAELDDCEQELRAYYTTLPLLPDHQ